MPSPPGDSKGIARLRRTSDVGLATVSHDGTALDIWFPAPNGCATALPTGSEVMSTDRFVDALGADMAEWVGYDAVRDVHRVPMRVTIDLDEPPASLYDLYLRLHLLSRRLIRPREADMTGLLSLLDVDVAWTSLGPCRASQVEAVRMRARKAGHVLQVHGNFLAPPLLDYVPLPDVRIADTRRVVLGAYLAPGTVVAQEGFCSMDAGTLGPCVVEGRISIGVTVGAGSDIGGGASLMGTTAGGNTRRVSIGERCLVGANAGCGIPLGDDCVIEAGCYVTGGVPVTLDDGSVVKAIELAGCPNLTFRRNGQSGRMEAVRRTHPWGGLNPVLHQTSRLDR